MTKILNIDALAQSEERDLVLDGKTHKIVEMTVENFIATTKAAAKLEGATIAEQIEATIEMIVRSVPTLAVDRLRQLSLTTLSTITDFVRGDDVEDETSAPAAEGEAGK